MKGWIVGALVLSLGGAVVTLLKLYGDSKEAQGGLQAAYDSLIETHKYQEIQSQKNAALLAVHRREKKQRELQREREKQQFLAEVQHDEDAKKYLATVIPDAVFRRLQHKNAERVASKSPSAAGFVRTNQPADPIWPDE